MRKTNQFAHASGIMVVTPQGKLARYFFGIHYPARDLRLALVEASDGKIGSPVDRVLLLCYHYDPATGQYTPAVMNLCRGPAAILTVARSGLGVDARAAATGAAATRSSRPCHEPFPRVEPCSHR